MRHSIPKTLRTRLGFLGEWFCEEAGELGNQIESFFSSSNRWRLRMAPVLPDLTSIGRTRPA